VHREGDLTDRARWLAYLDDIGFPSLEYYDPATPFGRWCELAAWHERVRRGWSTRRV
jgi:hypothetical protein